ncbi:hypothetical protein FHS96_005608 [Sphingomonas zeicaulis]|uniref:hypothetical protein n=1 Tax=Sphingomonas zeicaulis TaxID=1632740 RepID=UPI003D1F10C7
MSTQFRRYTVRIDSRQADAIEAIAKRTAETPTDVLRRAVDGYLASRDSDAVSERRTARIGEFSHLVLDLIMREQFPEFRERLIAETDRRMEQYHGA